MSTITLSAAAKQTILSMLTGLIVGHILYTSFKLGLSSFHEFVGGGSRTHSIRKQVLLSNSDKEINKNGGRNRNIIRHRISTKNENPLIDQIDMGNKNTATDAITTWEDLLNTPSEPKVWVVTPTYTHSQQYLYLTRTFQALYPVKHFIHWLIVIVNSDFRDPIYNKKEVAKLKQFLRQFPISIRLIQTSQRNRTESYFGDPKGVEGRRAALDYLRDSSNLAVDGTKGVVFFADDDNSYDPLIFYQMQQHTKTISIWPAGALEEWQIITPIVKNGKVKRIFGSWTKGRKFPVDFSQFAINISLIRKHPSATIPYIQGHEEDRFLRQLKIPLKKFQPLASNCTEILVWHTKSYTKSWNQSKRNQILRETKKMPTNTTKNLFRMLNYYNLNETHNARIESSRTRSISSTPSKSMKSVNNTTFKSTTSKQKYDRSNETHSNRAVTKSPTRSTATVYGKN